MFDLWKRLGFSNNARDERRPNADDAKALGFGITMTKEEEEEEIRKNDLMLSLLEKAIVTSGYFVPEEIPQLISVIRNSTRPFARSNTAAAFAGEVFLSTEEKRALGLNTRMKYTTSFIGYFNKEVLRTIEPKSVLSNMHIDAFHRVCRTFDLRKFKNLGFIDQVRIVTTSGCNNSSKLKKKYRLDDVPELPLNGCDTLCMCYYEPIIK